MSNESYFDCKKLRSGSIEAYFTILDELGAGGFGKVYSAVPTVAAQEEIGPDLPDVVAVKKVQSNKNKRELRGEIQIMKHMKALKILDSSKIMKYYGCFDAGMFIYIITELIHGEELFELVINNQLSQNQKAYITLQLAIGIEDMHKAGYIHRDLKPENIMFDTATGKLTLIDYGFTCYSTEQIGTCSGKVGTIVYYDPKVDTGDLESLMLSDWWSYGQIIYSLYTSKSLYNGGRRNSGYLKFNDKKYKEIIPAELIELLIGLTNADLEQKDRPSPQQILTAVKAINT